MRGVLKCRRKRAIINCEGDDATGLGVVVGGGRGRSATKGNAMMTMMTMTMLPLPLLLPLVLLKTMGNPVPTMACPKNQPPMKIAECPMPKNCQPKDLTGIIDYGQPVIFNRSPVPTTGLTTWLQMKKVAVDVVAVAVANIITVACHCHC
jgi:hypothetical protein